MYAAIWAVPMTTRFAALADPRLGSVRLVFVGTEHSEGNNIVSVRNYGKVDSRTGNRCGAGRTTGRSGRAPGDVQTGC